MLDNFECVPGLKKMVNAKIEAMNKPKEAPPHPVERAPPPAPEEAAPSEAPPAAQAEPSGEEPPKQ
jgi:hypothetical protein